MSKPPPCTDLPDLQTGLTHGRNDLRRSSNTRSIENRSAQRFSRQESAASVPLSDIHDPQRPLTYQEELVFIRSEDILKSTRRSTEQYEDTAVTVRFFIEHKEHLDSRVVQILEQIQSLNQLLKEVLFFLEPLQGQQKAAMFVTEDLDVLTRCTRPALDSVEKDFALFDITPMPPEARRLAWERFLHDFSQDSPCSLVELLELSCRYGNELVANIRAGVRSSPESSLWKSRICNTYGFDQSSTIASSSGVQEAHTKSLHYDPEREALLHSRTLLPVSVLDKSGLSSNKEQRELSRLEYKIHPADENKSSTTSTIADSKSAPTGEVSWFWLSQADIIPGYWATPWKHLFSEEVCLGATTVLPNLLEHFTDGRNCRFVKSQPYFIKWLYAGQGTYPGYAHQGRGGVVASGVYESVTFEGLEHAMMPVELLHSTQF